MIILEGKNLRKTYGYAENKVDAIKNISIEIEEGSFVSLCRYRHKLTYTDKIIMPIKLK